MDTADHHDTLLGQLSRLIIHASLGVKDISEVISQLSKTNFEQSAQQKHIKFGLSFSQNPVSLSDLIDELRDKKNFDLAIEVGNRSQVFEFHDIRDCFQGVARFTENSERVT